MEEERVYVEWLKGQKSKETKPAEEMVSWTIIFISLMCRTGPCTVESRLSGVDWTRWNSPKNLI